MIRAGALALLLALAACKGPDPASTQSCPEMRQAFDRAYAEAVKLGAARNFERQKASINTAQKTLIAMQNQGCCRGESNNCPALNVHE